MEYWNDQLRASTSTGQTPKNPVVLAAAIIEGMVI